MRRIQTAGLILLIMTSTNALACWERAASRYRIPAELLIAIGQVESTLNPLAVNRTYLDRTGTYDIGLMQINSSHLRRLTRYGIRERDLFDPCINIHVGAWLLADRFLRHGFTWDSIGAYHAACTVLKGAACRRVRTRYAWRVYRRLPPRSAILRQLGAPPIAPLEAIVRRSIPVARRGLS